MDSDNSNGIAFRKIPFTPFVISEHEINEVTESLRPGWNTTEPKTKELEKRLAEYVDVSRCVCLSSATASEELNLRILGIGEGDEVIVPAYTYTASAAAVIHVGATVVFVDCQKNSPEMDYDAMEAAITNKTKAVIPVDLGGIICDYDRIYDALERKKYLFVPSGNTDLGKRIQKALGRVAVVADCAQSLGSCRNGKMAGSIADFSSFSFRAFEYITAVDGGASAWRDIDGIDNEEIYKWFRLYSLHGLDIDAFADDLLGSWEYDIVAPLYKCNMTDLMAAVGLRLFERYEDLLQRRSVIIRRYDEMCDSLGLDHIKHEGWEFSSCGHLYLVWIPGISDEVRREVIIKMAELGISCNVHFKPLPMMTAYKSCDHVKGGGVDIKDYPNSYHLYENEITLPLHSKLSDEDVEYIVQCFTKIIEGL